jgi:transcriptional regulator with XRE-family HTH domain
MGYSPTVRGRWLVREVERLRRDGGLSMEAAAERLGWSLSKLYRLENGKSRITTDDLADMLDVYGVRSPERDALIQLCRDARKRGWWTAYADVFTGSYISMESEASGIRLARPRCRAGDLPGSRLRQRGHRRDRARYQPR